MTRTCVEAVSPVENGTGIAETPAGNRIELVSAAAAPTPVAPNRNQTAGIDLSPAVRDFLKLRSGAAVEWRFAEEAEVPAGPWKNWTREPALPHH